MISWGALGNNLAILTRQSSSLDGNIFTFVTTNQRSKTHYFLSKLQCIDGADNILSHAVDFSKITNTLWKLFAKFS